MFGKKTKIQEEALPAVPAEKEIEVHSMPVEFMGPETKKYKKYIKERIKREKAEEKAKKEEENKKSAEGAKRKKEERKNAEAEAKKGKEEEKMKKEQEKKGREEEEKKAKEEKEKKNREEKKRTKEEKNKEREGKKAKEKEAKEKFAEEKERQAAEEKKKPAKEEKKEKPAKPKIEEKTEKPPRKKMVIILVLIILVVMAGLAIFLLQMSKSSGSISPATEKPAEVPAETPAEIPTEAPAEVPAASEAVPAAEPVVLEEPISELGINIRTILSANIDTDGDGLTDEEEKVWGTNPAKTDTDGDGYPDGLEIVNFFSPLEVPLTRLSATDLVRLYDSADYGYLIYYPAKWTEEISEDGKEAKFVSSTGESVRVTILDNAESLSIAAWYSRQFPGAKLSQFRKTFVAGQEALWGPAGQTIYVGRGDKVYAIAYNSGDHADLNFKNTFEMMLKNFSFKPGSL